MEKVTASVVEIAREPELEGEPADVTELLESHDMNFMDEKLLLRVEQRKWLLEIESAPDEDAVKIIEMTIHDSEYYINLVGKVAAGLEKIDFNFYKSSTVSKMLSASVACLL